MEQYHLQQRSSLDILECPSHKSSSIVPEPPTPPPPAPVDPKDKPSIPPQRTQGPSKPEPTPGPSGLPQPTLGPTKPPRKPKPSLHVTIHGVLKRQPKARNYKCPAGCRVVCNSQCDLNHHVSTNTLCLGSSANFVVLNIKLTMPDLSTRKHTRLLLSFVHTKIATRHFIIKKTMNSIRECIMT